MPLSNIVRVSRHITFVASQLNQGVGVNENG
ncbi:hypothetical protein T05_16307 [Trichinella murrelli]|uniref:Uncharacterized protein n=1 Tax=Trichinella murrelli TaxID=144512 RepID=A0A0V0S5J4_9BILA|nr:hypothetical protein T05_16307 [Trichinella murrelli]